ncbi:protein spdB [Actinacidiphila sp. ITFR-21]|uniref:protein spdB n=1 Tax=Actinacidiphila sp. ITFR-21 TaxID=3075199 RepID=UPI00288ABB87|nr:protein spdB [Streptomyces sp. ITFR-21]WNI15721.1 protein spdB [Streptomyces sp. ITFR-21]
MTRTTKTMKKLAVVAPAVAMTAVSMVLTLAVVVMWLGHVMPWPVALVVGIGLDGGWLATLSYERRLAAQGDHSGVVTGVGWCFGVLAAGVLVVHALTAGSSAGAWLAVAWLPLAAKALWLVHGMWERTALTPAALGAIRSIQQTARDDAAVSRAMLRAQATTEETRLTAVTEAGARVARVQAETARTLSGAWMELETARQGEGTDRALTSVTPPVTDTAHPRWELPVWGPSDPVPALDAAPALTDADLDRIVGAILASSVPPPSYREMSVRFRAAGHSASETRLRAAWRRTTADTGITG